MTFHDGEVNMVDLAVGDVCTRVNVSGALIVLEVNEKYVSFLDLCDGRVTRRSPVGTLGPFREYGR